ncbi:MAG: hypothetical protein JWM63_2575 [Gammaproteobacteria bacterium]|jgi:hypothetical protein|nr:hypothetical protein [Gammaproteobacteria bacterium]
MTMTSLLAFTPWPPLSAVILLMLLVTALYLARGTAHQAIHAIAVALSRGLRLASHSVAHAEERLGTRNREVLLAAGREAKERIVEREFVRVGDTVRKDLANYPDMHRRLSEAIIRIEEDQEKAVEVPPEAPGWAQAVEVVANLDARNAGVDILSDIHKSMVKAHGEVMEDYRKASSERHSLLRRMMPDWRLIQETLGRVNKSVESVIARSMTIDRHMEEYDAIVRGEDRAVSVLSSSSIVYFFVSALVLAVATAGAAINFTLIARPMAEMVGGTSFIGAFRTADIAALVIIMVEISMGLFLMESLRITRLFPVIGALSDKMRVRMIFITFVILLLMASVEAGLAYMREVLLQDELATSSLLRGDTVSAVNGHLWITTAAQMGMGFILPFALVFVAIPLETFVHSLRTVMGLTAIGMLRALSLILRVAGNGSRHLGTLAQQMYDLPLFVPLWIETRMAAAASEEAANLHASIEAESWQEAQS